MASVTVKTSRSRSSRILKPLAQPFRIFPDIVKLLFKRQRHYLGLSLLALLDIILAVGLVTNASFFTQAVDRVVLLQELNEFTRVTGRPPFSTSIYVFPSRRNPVTLQNAEDIQKHVSGTLSSEVGLPLQSVNLQMSSGGLMMQAPPDSPMYVEGKSYLGNVEAVYIANVAPQMEIVEGDALDESGSSGDVIDVWVHERMVQEMGLQLGEVLQVGVTVKDPNQMKVRVAGIWHAKDPKDRFWFGNPNSTLASSLLVRRSDYVNRIEMVTAGASGEANWYIVLDDSKLLPVDSAKYISGFERGLGIIDKYVPGARMNTPPLDPLKNFVDRSRTMTVLLLAYNLPAFGILLYFLVLTSATIAQWQRREMSVLVSRGLNVGGVLNLILVEQLLLFAIGYPLGIAFGMGLAYVMGYTESFLSFTNRAPLPVSLQGLSLQLTLVALAISLFARLYPTLKAARSSMLAEERERARPVGKPFWFRFYLDVILLFPTVYFYLQMKQQGSLAGLIVDKAEDLYNDPLLILVPALFVVTIALVTMRVFNLVMRLVDMIATKSPWISIHLAFRQLGRQSLDYVTPLLLVIISLALGVYTLSMAGSLDQWLVDRMYYRTGADLNITPTPGIEGVEPTDGNWIPTQYDFARLPGVKAAARLGDYGARFILSNVTQPSLPSGSNRNNRNSFSNPNEVNGRFLAIDRAEFASAAYWRSDFAGESLGSLMNRLAATPDGVLVSETAMQQGNLNIGDSLTAQIHVDNVTNLTVQLTVVGVYKYFPTVYEEEAPAAIGNLDYLTSWLGYITPHNLLLKLKPGADPKQTLEAIVNTMHISYLVRGNAPELVETEQAKMERVGIFGTLSVGFLATAVMAILSLLIYSYASLQERAYRFAVLHAVGLSRRQIMIQVILEYAFLAAFGAIAGSLIGLGAATLFVPFFRFTGEVGTPLPPLLPLIAGGQLRNLSIAFAVIIVIAEVTTVASTLHSRLAQMLKRAWL